MSKIANIYSNTGLKINRAYWAAERFLSEAALYVMPVFLALCLFFFFAQMDYIKNGYKRDFTQLPQAKQERLNYLKSEEIRLFRKAEQSREKLDFTEAREINSQRYPIMAEMDSIVKQAPYDAWSYRLYLAVGAVRPHKD